MVLLDRIKQLVRNGEFRISEHGLDELHQDKISVRELVASLVSATVVEEYPDYPKGECILLLQSDSKLQPVHAVWGIPKGQTQPAVLITAYRPETSRWSEDFMRRRT